ncbi:MAG: pyrroline-5-carboxylate reductase [Deltaproteobacteria bacterium]|nr:pyrroline-5-carboxylate reductase [Deltaproteobacteria bacterium]
MSLDINNALGDKSLGFIGAGNMAEAMIRGIIQNQVVLPDRILASDLSGERREYISRTFGMETVEENRSLVDQSNVIFLAVKPQAVPQVLKDMASDMGPEKLLVSIVAGVPIKTLSSGLPKTPRIVRTMPNTPMTVMEGAMAIASDSPALPEDLETVETLFRPLGSTVRIEEKLIDAVTGLSGSGPAYVFMILEALADGGVKMGLPRDVAETLAAQTLMGSAKLFLETRQNPGQLKCMVTSPGGTTIAGIHELEKGGIRASLMSAVESATERSIELGKS